MSLVDDREQHAEPRRRGSPPPPPARDEGVHAGRSSISSARAFQAIADELGRRRRVARRDGSRSRVRLPPADHGDRGAPRRADRRPGALPAWSDAIITPAISPEGGPRAVLRADGRVRRVPPGTCSRSAAQTPQDDLISALLAGTGRRRRAQRGRGPRHRRAPHRGGTPDDGRPDRERRAPSAASSPSQLAPHPTDESRLLPAAIEELLRFEGPARAPRSTAGRQPDVELGGKTIRRGEMSDRDRRLGGP